LKAGEDVTNDDSLCRFVVPGDTAAHPRAHVASFYEVECPAHGTAVTVSL